MAARSWKLRGSIDQSLVNTSTPKRRIKSLSKTKKVVARISHGSYSEYLLSKHWKSKRTEALRYHGKKCNRCGSTRLLQVHHKTYERLGREKMADLEVLCADCHALEHQEKNPDYIDALSREFAEMFC